MIAIVFDAAQASRFVLPADRSLDQLRIVALSPAARITLAQKGFQTIASSEMYGDESHCAVAVAAARNREIVNGIAAKLLGEHAAGTHRLIDFTTGLYFTAARLWFTLGDRGPWYCFDGRTWQSLDTREGAFATLLRAIIPHGPPHVSLFGNYPFQWLMRLLQKLVLWRARRAPGWIVTNRGRMHFGIEKLIKKPGERFCIPAAPLHFRRDLATRLRHLFSRQLPDLFVVIVGWPDRRLDAQTDRVIDSVMSAVDDPVLRRALALYEREIRSQVRGFVRAERDIGLLLDLLAPRLAASYQINNHLAVAIWAACLSKGVHRIVFNHNSISDATGSSPGADASMALAVERRLSRVPSSVYLAFSPVHYRCLARYLPEARGRIAPFRAQPNVVATTPSAGSFRILYADNYMAWRDHLPVVMQTSDELYDSLEQACRAVQELSGVTLVIRLKPKAELNARVVEHLATTYPNVEISDYALPFKQELARSNVLIASMSTTIEEAIANDIPVLLYGRQGRYSHLSDTAGGVGGPVYRARSARELSAAIALIRGKRHGHVPSELKQQLFVWSTENPTVAQLIEQLNNGDKVKLI
jgi:hypothetical protein